MAYVYVAYKDYYTKTDGTVVKFLPMEYGELAGMTGDDLTAFDAAFASYNARLDGLVSDGTMTVEDLSGIALKYTFSSPVAETIFEDDGTLDYYGEMANDPNVDCLSYKYNNWLDRT